MPESNLQSKPKESKAELAKSNAIQVDGASPTMAQAHTATRRARIDHSRLTQHDVAALQRTVGNQAVASMLGRGASQAQSHSVIQAKLTVGPAHDAYEEEADSVAASVMRSTSTAPIRRSEQEEEESDELQRTPVINRIQRNAPIGLAGGPVDGDLERSIHQAKNGGSSLSSGIRRQLEPKLNADLSGVKVHTDSKSVQLNRDLGAKAFTHKDHIFYGAGQSPSNLKLTTHEAVHTIQQGAVQQKSVQRKNEDTTEDGESAAVEQSSKLAMIGRKAAMDGTIQRSVGFEFQTGWGIVKNEPDPTYVAPQQPPPQQPVPLTKTQKVGKFFKGVGSAIAKPFKAIGKGISKLVNGPPAPPQPVGPVQATGPLPPEPGRMHTRFPKAHNHVDDGYVKLSTDDANTTLGAEVEWVIDPPIPDNATPEEVEAIIIKLMNYINQMRALSNLDTFRLSQVTGKPADDVVEIQPGAKGNEGREMKANPQATGGIKFEHMYDMFKEIAGQKTAAKEFNSGVGAGRANTMTSKVDTANIDGSPQLKGLLAFIVNYMSMNKSQGAQSDPYKYAADYAKVNTQFLLRTDFATLFRLLPHDEKEKYGLQGGRNPDAFVNLVKTVWPDIDLNDPVFERGVKNTSNKTIKYFPLTRKQWIQGIADGEDKLSGASAYAKQQGYAGELESMGNINGKSGKLDKVGRDEDTAKTGIIMEFRSKTDSIAAEEIPGYIRATFGYIQKLNARKTEQEKVQDQRLKDDSNKRRNMNFWG